MKLLLRQLCILLLLGIPSVSLSQSMKWGWSRSFAGGGNISVATNSQNGIFVAGQYSNSTQVGSYTFTAVGGNDIVLTKYDTSGNLLWAKTFGGSADDTPENITTDKNGDIFIIGSFSGSISFDAVSLTSSGGKDGFIVKLNATGTILWAKKIGGNADDVVSAIKCYKDDIYIGGAYLSTDFSINGIALAKTHPFHLFYARLDNTGNALWAKMGTDNVDNILNNIEVQDDYSVDIFGFFSGNVNFNPSSSGLPAGNIGRMFHLKTSQGGSFISQAYSGLTTNRMGTTGGVAMGTNKSVVFTGTRSGISVPRPFYGLLVKKDSSDNDIPSAPVNEIQVLAGNTERSSYTNDVATRHDGGFLGTGNFYGGSDFGNGIATPPLPNAAGYGASMVWKTDSNLLTKNVLTTGIKKNFTSGFYSIAIDTTTHIAYAAGYYFTIPAGIPSTFEIGEDTLINNTKNILLSKIYPDAPAAPALTIQAGNDTVICTGGTANLRATVAGGNPSYFYSWSPTTGVQNPNAAVTTASPTASTTYTLTVTDASLNSSTTTIHVSVTQSQATITASGSLQFCQGGSVTLTCSPANSYLWSTGATTQSITVNAGGTYSVTANTDCGPRNASVLVTVNTPPAQPVITASGPLQFCEGGSVTLSAPASTTYNWSNGATTQSITVNASGNYSVTVTNAAGCSSAASATTAVTVWAKPSKPVISAAGALQFCEGGSVQLASTSAATYLWSNAAATQNITVNSSGSYSVTVTSAEGCSSLPSDPVSVTVWAKPAQPTITPAGPSQICEGAGITLSSSTGNAYTWSTGATAQSINVSTAGNYSVTVTSSQGCSSVASAVSVVTVNALPPVPTVNRTGNSLNSSAADGNQWYFEGTAIPGATSPTLAISGIGNYYVKVTNAAGCSSNSALFVVENFSGRVATLRNGEPFRYVTMPNPAISHATLSFQLTSSARVSVSLVNGSGRLAALPVPQKQLAAGNYNIRIDQHVQKLNAGMYFIVYRINDEQVVDQLLITK